MGRMTVLIGLPSQVFLHMFVFYLAFPVSQGDFKSVDEKVLELSNKLKRDGQNEDIGVTAIQYQGTVHHAMFVIHKNIVVVVALLF